MASNVSAGELSHYLFLTANLQDGHPSQEIFNDFLHDMRMLYALRMLAEMRFKDNRALATMDKSALPLDWCTAETVLLPQKAMPRLGVVTKIATDTTMVLFKLMGNIRKQLRRQREMTAVGRVQQVDSHCLRWISKRPGLSLLEKAGAKQEILSVVRKEVYDTLENRVLKSFLVSAEKLTAIWLKDHKDAIYAQHEHYQLVKRFYGLTRGILASEFLNDVKILNEVPTPNYTLQQDPLYSIIWKAYLIVTQYIQVTLRLWEHREELSAQLTILKQDVKFHLKSSFVSELWIYPIDGKNDFFENYLKPQPSRKICYTQLPPYILDELGDGGLDLRVIDLFGQHQDDALLLPDVTLHPTAKPRLINYSSPYVDKSVTNNKDYQSRIYYLNDILCTLIKDSNDAAAQKLLTLYFEQLRSTIGGRNWLILIPDFAESEFQGVLRLCAERTSGLVCVRLLWRTMAYALGQQNTRQPRVECLRKSNVYDKATFQVVNGKFQRASFRVRKEAYRSPEPSELTRPSEWYLPPLPENMSESVLKIYEQGALLFWKATRENPAFYDQLLGLYIVIQDNDAEMAKFKELIAPNEQHPGGFSSVSEECSDLGIEKGSINFYFYEGPKQDERAHLKLFEDSIDVETDEVIGMQMAISSSPGQGLTELNIICRDKQFKLTMHKVALGYIENNKWIPASVESLNLYMERSFPPDMPDVESDSDLFFDQFPKLRWHRNSLRPEDVFAVLSKDSFAKAKYKYNELNPCPDDEPLGVLVRCNVFGTHCEHRRPFDDCGWTQFDYNALFKRILLEFKRWYKTDVRKAYGYFRLLAWTYQYDNDFFDPVRSWAVKKVLKDEKRPEIITFCSNFCRKEDEWRSLLSAIVAYKDYEHSRLLYNLLMFCPTFPLKSGICENNEIQKTLVDWLCNEFRGNRESKVRNACLRSLLFLLRIRRFQKKKTFAKKDFESDVYAEIDNICNISVRPNLTRSLQVMLKAYLDGKGKLEGLPALLGGVTQQV